MFKLILSNGHQDLELFFKVRNTEISQKWFEEIKKNYELYETDRFTDWGDNNYIEQLNECIDTINSFQFIIDKKIDKNSSQPDFNYLHKFFENYRGEILEETQWFKSAPDEIRQAIQKFNILIHHAESECRTKGKHPTLVVTFKNRPRYELSESDCKNFTCKWTSGTVYIDYCQVGKTVLDVFKDRDNIAEAIRPQTHYSADFMIKFGPSIPWWFYYPRIIAIYCWIKFKKFKFKNFNIGMIPVADLVTYIDKRQLIKYNRIKKIECIK